MWETSTLISCTGKITRAESHLPIEFARSAGRSSQSASRELHYRQRRNRWLRSNLAPTFYFSSE
jgi:hypothetical protein